METADVRNEHQRRRGLAHNARERERWHATMRREGVEPDFDAEEDDNGQMCSACTG